MASPNEFNQPVSYLNGGPFETTWGPYPTKEAACEALKNEVDSEGRNMRMGKTVAIGTITDYIEHAWQGGFEDKHLKPYILSKYSVNLFDFNARTQGRALTNEGVFVDNPAYDVSDRIPVTPGKTYTSSVDGQTGDGTRMRFVTFYRADNLVLNSPYSSSTQSFIVPANVAYARVTPPVNTLKFQLQEGVFATRFEPFGSVELSSAVRLAENAQDELLQTIREALPSTIVADKGITTNKVADKAITADKTSFIHVSPNLLNLIDPNVVPGKYLENNGTLVSGNFWTSGYMPCMPGAIFTVSPRVRKIAMYTDVKSFIPSAYIDTTQSTPYTFQIPAGTARFFCVSIANDYWDTAMVVQGTTVPEYTPFGKADLDKNLIPSRAISKENLNFIETIEAKNLLNPSDPDVMLGKYINASGQTLDGAFNTSGFIQVTPGGKLTFSPSGRFINYYNSSKQINTTHHKDVSGALPSTQITPAGMAYARVSVRLQDWPLAMVERGDVISPFEPFFEGGDVLEGLKIKKENVMGLVIPEPERKITPLISMPSKEYILSGDTTIFYHRNLLDKFKPYDYSVRFEGGNFTNMKNRSLVIPSSSQLSVDVKLYNDEFITVLTKTVSIVIGSRTKSTGAPVINAFGDSHTYNGAFLALLLNLAGITLVGMRRSYNEEEIAKGRTILADGRGGWSLMNYFTRRTSATDSFSPFMHPADPYTYYGDTSFWKKVVNGDTSYNYEGFHLKAAEIGFSSSTGLLINPQVNALMYNRDLAKYVFWNGSSWADAPTSVNDIANWSFNYAKYRAAWNIPAPTVFLLHLGLNDFRDQPTLSVVNAEFGVWKNRVNEMILNIKANVPGIKFVVALPTVFTGDPDNTGQEWAARQTYFMWKVRELIIANFDNREAENVFVVDFGATVDPEYGFSHTTQLPFPEYAGSETRKVMSNIPHPTTQGYYQEGRNFAAFVQATR
jgi:hypothetical protein